MQRWTEAMRAGRYADAWTIERANIAARSPATRDDPTLPYHRRWVWDGRTPDGRDVLVRCYHGLGDTIQFARYLPVLASRARALTLEVQPRLIPLLRGLFAGAIHPFHSANPLPPRECDVEITELPCALSVPPEVVSAPYLSWPAASLPAGTIGLCHAAGEWDHARSVPERLLAPLCAEHPCVTLVAGATTLPVLNPAGCPFDMAETAALVAGCDLVVTVDTMIAHLAGALGRPTWLLLKNEPDWRWDPSRRTSAWYPTLRQYLQPRVGAWPSVVDAVMAEFATERGVAA